MKASRWAVHGRWRRLVLLALPVALGVGLIFLARALSLRARVLAREETTAGRVVTYALEPGQRLRIPIESDTEVLRLVMHVFRHGPLDPELHMARLTTSVSGGAEPRTETLDVPLPGLSRRAVAEDGDVTVGDPLALNVDVHGVKGGDLTLLLVSAPGTDGVLVRAYRREALGLSDALERRATLSDTEREHLARRGGALDWLDLDAADRATLVAARWRKVSAFSDGDLGVVQRAISLAPRDQQAASPRIGAELATLDLFANELAAGTATGEVAVVARAVRDPASRLNVHLFRSVAGEQTLEGAGMVRFDLPAGETARFEVGVGKAETVRLEATEPGRVTLTHSVAYFRTSADRPVVVTAGPSPLVLRVSARLPRARSQEGVAVASLLTTTTTQAGATLTAKVDAPVSSSRVDRYDEASPTLRPSERFSTLVLVPAGGRATTPHRSDRLARSDNLDLSLSELDPQAPPRPLAARPSGEVAVPAPEVAEWEGFFARRPSNADAFSTAAEGRVRVAKAAPTAETNADKISVLRVARPRIPGAVWVDGILFEPAHVSFTLNVPAGRQGSASVAALPFRLRAKAATDVLVRFDGGHARRRTAGLAHVLTTDRVIHVDGEARARLLLGDDLEPGRHEVSFVAPAGAELFVHLPWVGHARRQESHWVVGGGEP